MTEATKTEQETKLKKEEKTIKASSCTSRKRCWVSVFAILFNSI